MRADDGILPGSSFPWTPVIAGGKHSVSGYFSLADGRALPLRDGFVVGRTTGCDLVIDDGKASRRHLRVIVEAGVVEVEDLGSSNGTLLNGKPVTRRVVRDGDQIQIGKTVLVYREGTLPGTAGKGATAPAAPVFAEEDDLFGGTAAEPKATPSPAPAEGVQRPKPNATTAPPPAAASQVSAPPSSPPPVAAPAPPTVVEFADEIVEVRKAPAPAAAASKSAAGAPAAAGGMQVQQRVLQFSRQAASRSAIGDDLGQMSPGVRSLVLALVLAFAAGIAWLVAQFVR